MQIVIIAVAALIVIVVLGAGVYMIRRERKDSINERLGRYTSEFGGELDNLDDGGAASALQEAGSGAYSLARDELDKAVAGTKFSSKWKVQLNRADLKITPGEFAGLHVVAMVGFFLVGNVLFSNIVFAGIAGMVGFFAPRVWVSMKIGGRFNAFQGQLPDALQMWVNGLRSGYSVMQAIEAIAKEAADPMATEFKRVVREVQLGISMEEAFDHLLERIPSEDLDLVITAVNIQREVGGNLAEILEIISHTIRERIKLKGDIRVLTAQGRVTGYIIGGLPIVLLMLLMVINPEYVGRLFTNRMCGWPMLCCGGSMIAMGFAAISKIVTIEI